MLEVLGREGVLSRKNMLVREWLRDVSTRMRLKEVSRGVVRRKRKEEVK